MSLPAQDDLFPRVSLVKELCRVLDASEKAILCAMSHRQLYVDGHVVLPRHDFAWSEPHLAGRIARLHGRSARLFHNSSPAVNLDETLGVAGGGHDGDI